MLQRLKPRIGSSRFATDLPPLVSASRFIRKMCGSSQTILLEGTDRNIYVVKLRGNPPYGDNAAGELLGSLLCDAVGLPVPQSCFVLFTERFLDQYSDVWPYALEGRVRPPAGLYYGTTFVGTTEGMGRPFQLLSTANRSLVHNRAPFCGMYIFDIWANHLAWRQSLFLVSTKHDTVQVIFIDNSLLFAEPALYLGGLQPQAKFRRKDAVNVEWNDSTVLCWIDRFKALIPGALMSSLKIIPPQWWTVDPAELRATFMHRLETIDELVHPFALLEKRSM